MPLRPAAVEDAPVIGELIRELASYERLEDEVVWTEQELAVALFGEGAVPQVLLAESDDGEVVGFALYFRTFSTFLGRPGIWLEDLFIRPAHRSKGYGRALLAALAELSDGRVEWKVVDWNESAMAFYRSLGARPVEGWTTYRWLPGDRIDA
jgi:GNAT superfamily N-acetyltransferase